MSDMLIAFARGGYTDTNLVPKEYTWEQLAQRMARPAVGEKDGSYLIRGGVLKEPVRNNDNLLEAELLVIDGDSSFDPETGEVFTAIDPDETNPEKVLKGNCTPIEVARDALDQLGYRYIIHTTHTHTPGLLNKWRAYIPAKMHSKEELEAAVEFVMAQMHGAGCYVEANKESKVWAQPWFLPRVKMKYLDSFKCYASLVGLDVDVKAAVEVAEGRKATEKAIRAAEKPFKAERATVHTGDSPITLFNKAADIDTFRVLLGNEGYKFAGKRGKVWRFIAPGSTTKTPGVTVFKGAKHGDLVAYSHHGAHDPLSHRLNDAFGILTRLRHKGNEEAALDEAKQVTGWKPSDREVNLDEFETFKVDPENFKQAPSAKETPKPAGPIFIRAKAFADAWKPAEYLVDGLIQRGYCYSFTSPTGHGKTAIVLLLAAHIGTGRAFAGVETLPGRVGYFAAENPNDVQARWIGLQEELQFDDADVWFCPDTIDLKTSYDQIAAEVEANGGFDLIVVDTSQAFFQGDDENSNSQMVAHAKAMRRLTTLPGNPCVIILTHPVKNPAKDNLLPRGGGGFLAEVDGNLTLWSDGGNLELHHQGKFRGPGFAPLNFTLTPVTPARLLDAKLRPIPTVVARFVTEEQHGVMLQDLADDQDKVMLMILESEGRASVSDMCKRAGWLAKNGTPHKGKVHRILAGLKTAKLVIAKRNGKPTLTPAGEKEIKAKAQALGLRPRHRESTPDDHDDSTF